MKFIAAFLVIILLGIFFISETYALADTTKKGEKKITKQVVKKEKKKTTPKKIVKKVYPKKMAQKTPLYAMSIGGFTFQTELARTRQEHEQGLSGRQSLTKDQGMLFVFPKEGVYSFWMKDMKFPIDIIWIGKDATIKGHVGNVKPESYPSLYQPGHAILYALEVPNGFIEQHSIVVGEKVKLAKIVTGSK